MHDQAVITSTLRNTSKTYAQVLFEAAMTGLNKRGFTSMSHRHSWVSFTMPHSRAVAPPGGWTVPVSCMKNDASATARAPATGMRLYHSSGLASSLVEYLGDNENRYVSCEEDFEISHSSPVFRITVAGMSQLTATPVRADMTCPQMTFLG